MSKKTAKVHKKIKLDVPGGTSFDALVQKAARPMSKDELKAMREKIKGKRKND